MLTDTLIPRLWASNWNDEPLNRMRREMERTFEEPFFQSPPLLNRKVEISPPCDLEDTEGHYLFALDLPGINKDDIQIDISGNQLTISGERQEEKRQDKDSQRYVERRYGSFTRSFTLPSEVDADKVEANYDNGVLRIAVPKTEKTKRSHIKISSGKSGVFAKLLGGKKSEEKAA